MSADILRGTYGRKDHTYRADSPANSQNPRQGSPPRERLEELAHDFLRKANVYNL